MWKMSDPVVREAEHWMRRATSARGVISNSKSAPVSPEASAYGSGRDGKKMPLPFPRLPAKNNAVTAATLANASRLGFLPSLMRQSFLQPLLAGDAGFKSQTAKRCDKALRLSGAAAGS